MLLDLNHDVYFKFQQEDTSEEEKKRYNEMVILQILTIDRESK